MTVTDLITAVGDSRRYNFHSHTQYCDGHATIEEFAEAAVAIGMEHYGFSPHSPIPFESSCNMSFEDVPRFIEDVKEMQRRYDGKIKFYTAMEVDFLDNEWGPAVDYFKGLPLDYIIGSVHFLPSDQGGYVDIDGGYERFQNYMTEHFHNDIRHVVELFFDRSEAMLQAGGFEIIGHFDKITHNASIHFPALEEQPWYHRRVNDLIDLIAEKGVIAEINTKAYTREGRFYPSSSLFRRLIDAHIPLLVNSDTHYPNLIDISRADAFTILDKSS